MPGSVAHHFLYSVHRGLCCIVPEHLLRFPCDVLLLLAKIMNRSHLPFQSEHLNTVSKAAGKLIVLLPVPGRPERPRHVAQYARQPVMPAQVTSLLPRHVLPVLRIPRYRDRTLPLVLATPSPGIACTERDDVRKHSTLRWPT